MSKEDAKVFDCLQKFVVEHNGDLSIFVDTSFYVDEYNIAGITYDKLKKL